MLCCVIILFLSVGVAGSDDLKRDGQHDFDFEIGTWKTHLKRLQHPLTGSTTWVEYEGTTVVRKVWNGRANLVELVADGPAGHFEGLSLRLYNPESHQWSLNFASASSGTMSLPTIGEFKNGRGEFYNQETLNGRTIFVRFVISDITPNSCRFEQAFSDDGGKTWEVNWIATILNSVGYPGSPKIGWKGDLTDGLKNSAGKGDPSGRPANKSNCFVTAGLRPASHSSSVISVSVIFFF